MKAADLTGHDAVVECLAIVERCAGATATGRYAEGYRAAASDIRALIQARFGGKPMSSVERDLRDVEVEARTLSRVIRLLRHEQTRSSSAATRRMLGDVISSIEDDELDPCVQLTRDAG